MNKLDEILNELDAGGDLDVVWSDRSGDSVLLEYADGSSILVTAKVTTPKSSGSEAGSTEQGASGQ